MNIDASSGANVKGDFKITNAVEIAASSGSNIRVGVTATSVMVKASSGSNAAIEGKANSGLIDISSGALCKADELKLDNLEAEATSGGNLSVNVSGRLKVRASSGGLVKYKGRPK